MNWRQNKGILGLILAGLVTLNVTACVKNKEKQVPAILPQGELSSQQISAFVADGPTVVNINEETDKPIVNLSKDYKLDVREISLFQIQAGSHNNDKCQASGAFLYSFYFVMADGEERIFNPGRDRERLNPGIHTLRLKIENGSHCKVLSMNFNIIMQGQPGLVTTANQEAQYLCETVVRQGAIQNNTLVEVQTSPLAVRQYRINNRNQVRSVRPIMNEETFCTQELRPNMNCSETMEPIEKSKKALASISKRCRPANREFARGWQANLQVTKPRRQINLVFACNTRGANRHSLRLDASNCKINYNLGSRLSNIQEGSRVIVNKNRMKINFHMHPADLAKLPEHVYIMIVALDEDRQAEKISLGDYTTNKDEFHVGPNQIIMKQRGQIFQALRDKEINAKNLRVVFSASRELKDGVLNLALSDLCNKDTQSVVLNKRNKVKKSLCE